MNQWKQGKSYLGIGDERWNQQYLDQIHNQGPGQFLTFQFHKQDQR